MLDWATSESNRYSRSFAISKSTLCTFLTTRRPFVPLMSTVKELARCHLLIDPICVKDHDPSTLVTSLAATAIQNSVWTLQTSAEGCSLVQTL